jgi:hypothetical protein
MAPPSADADGAAERQATGDSALTPMAPPSFQMVNTDIFQIFLIRKLLISGLMY